MYCSACGTAIPVTMKFCPHCGAKVPVTQQVNTVPAMNTSGSAGSAPTQKLGLSLSALIIGIVVSLFGLADYGMVSSGSADYIYVSEVGWLFIGSLVSLGLAIPAMVLKQRIRVAALIVSILSVLIVLAVAPYGA